MSSRAAELSTGFSSSAEMAGRLLRACSEPEPATTIVSSGTPTRRGSAARGALDFLPGAPHEAPPSGFTRF
ncbi:hypothetical protein R6L23_33475 [Streptomyces sp. SR27]|uniref:hypothetical protein n=1 Tax=Streptomyces sp. SR27 TaxID=3076630 RepID=UPI00295C0CA8|nr:hypothetical protein [Streptomyces sp. SR27]MDV9193066.1 hypothetical protein [Streptomyces sp. SR27]